MNDFNARVHHAIDKAIVRNHEAARQLPKATIEEPTEWGSVVRAVRAIDGDPINVERLRWQRTSHTVSPPWFSEAGHAGIAHFAYWGELIDPEVVRVGVGDTADKPSVPADEVREVVAYLRAFADRPYLATRAYAYKRAADYMESQLLRKDES